MQILSRRSFLKEMMLAVLAAGLNPLPLPPATAAERPITNKSLYHSMPHRLLGKTREMVPILGFSGAKLAGMSNELAAAALIRAAFDIPGKTVLDLVWEEERAVQLVAWNLVDVKRENLLLVTGTDGHGKSACLKQLEKSLDLLGTDYIDLWMIKESIYEASPSLVFSMDGAIGAILEAKRKKMIRHAGLAGYRNADFFMSAIHGFFDFEAAEIPMNGNGRRYLEFERTVHPHLRARNIGTILSNPLPEGPDGSYPLPAKDILGLFWSQLINVAAVGVDSAESLGAYIEIANRFMTIPRVLRERLLPKLDALGQPA